MIVIIIIIFYRVRETENDNQCLRFAIKVVACGYYEKLTL